MKEDDQAKDSPVHSIARSRHCSTLKCGDAAKGLLFEIAEDDRCGDFRGQALKDLQNPVVSLILLGIVRRVGIAVLPSHEAIDVLYMDDGPAPPLTERAVASLLLDPSGRFTVITREETALCQSLDPENCLRCSVVRQVRVSEDAHPAYEEYGMPPNVQHSPRICVSRVDAIQ